MLQVQIPIYLKPDVGKIKKLKNQKLRQVTSP